MSRPPDDDELRRRRALCVMLLIPLLVSSVRLFRGTSPPGYGQPGSRSAGAATRLNPNTAAWWELTLLEGVGPERAKAIVAYRDAHEALAPGEAIFRTPRDLLRVSGIGPKTVESMTAELSFDSDR